MNSAPMTAEHETMTAEEIEDLKIWTPFWSEADCRKALGVIEAQAATIAHLQAALAVARGGLTRIRDCDWVITPADRMDAVREIARTTLAQLDAALKGAHPAQGGE